MLQLQADCGVFRHPSRYSRASCPSSDATKRDLTPRAGFITYEANGHIDLLFTSPAYCRRGFASTLLRHAETALAARGISALVTEASLAARPFFERFGFEVTEEQHVQRGGVGFRRYAMRKSLVS
ncbi:MAG: GNAT family N-acetyltransferase [Thiohalomonadaceae bacterium]